MMAEETEAREELMTKWQEKWINGHHGRWTYTLIPNVKKWVKRPYGEVDYYISQALSGHGCFMAFLHNRNRAKTNLCTYCGAVDDADHALFKCDEWIKERQEYREKTGEIFTASAMSSRIIASEEGWNVV